MVPPDGDFHIVPALLLSSVLVIGCEAPATKPEAPVRVAAAADLSLAFEEMGKLFSARTGKEVVFSFGASGTLAKQLSQGAPFDLFAAANPEFVDSAVQAGACDGATKALYARGHLVLWTKLEGALVHTLADLTRAEIRHIAIANPDHAPYGKAAREALTRSGLWPALQGKIVHAENVRQALQFAQTGNADVALVARSLVVKGDQGISVPIDPALHGPIEQTLVECRRGRNRAGAHELAQLVRSREGQALLARYGFGGSAEKLGQ